MNSCKPFDHILEARAILARVRAGLVMATVAKNSCRTPEPEPEPADVAIEAPAALESPALELAPDIIPEPGFGPEPDGALEMPWAAPDIAPPWAGQAYSGLEQDEFSSFRQGDAAEIEAVKVDELLETPKETEPPQTDVTPTQATLTQTDEQSHVEETAAVEASCAVNEPRSVLAAHDDSRSFMRRISRKSVFMPVATAAVIVLMFAVGLGFDRGISLASNDYIAIDVDDNSPLVDLTAPVEEPVVVITDESADTPAPPPMPIRAIDWPHLHKTVSAFLNRLGASGKNFFASTAWAADVPRPEEADAVLASPEPSPQTAVAEQETETAATPEEESASVESPFKSDPPDKAVSGYTLEASRNHFTAGEVAEVTFTLKKDGRTIDGEGLDVHFEANSSFPNLRTVSRILDANGSFIVRGLRPGQSGHTSLRLVVGGDTYVEMPVTIAAAKAVTAPPPVLERPVPMLAATAAPVLATPVNQPTEWLIAPGLLRGQLENWSAQAGYQLVWKARNDFEMFSQASFQGDFTGAVKKLMGGMHSQGSGLLRATIYQGNKVLEVTEE